MIDNSHAKELLDAIEAYGDRERLYGQELQKEIRAESAHGVLGERDYSAARALNEVKRLLQPHMEDPRGPHGLFDVPDRGEEGRDYPEEDIEVKFWNEE